MVSYRKCINMAEESGHKSACFSLLTEKAAGVAHFNIEVSLVGNHNLGEINLTLMDCPIRTHHKLKRHHLHQKQKEIG